MDWKSVSFYVLDRFKEPSTYAGIAGLVAASHLAVSPELLTSMAGVAMAIASSVSVALKEGK